MIPVLVERTILEEMMTRLIGCLGYVGRPEFAYDCPSDRIQIESMLAARGDRIVMAHWDDLDAAALTARAWDVRRQSWGPEDFARCDVLLILEAPVPGSKMPTSSTPRRRCGKSSATASRR